MRRFPIPSLLVLLLASHASALTYSVTASLDGLQETPPNASPGTGTLTGSYDDVTNILLWSGSFSGLTGTTTNAHFHGPAAPGVGPAGVQVGMTAVTGDVFPLGVTSGNYSGEATISAAQETDLLAGLWYANIHSTTFAGGEIRGQVYLTAVPEPATVALLVLGLGGVARAGRRPS